MKNIENPASRLYDILIEISEMCDIGDGYSTGYNNEYKNVWSKVLKIDEKDIGKMMQGIIGVQNLYDQTFDIVQNDKYLNTDKNKKYLNNIYHAIYSVNFEGDMSKFVGLITSETLLAFSYIKDLIEVFYELPRISLSKEEKNSLIKSLDILIEDFLESDLPEDLKSVCTSNIINIKDSLVHYKIYGANRLHESLAKAIGEIYLLGDSTVENKDDKNIENLFNIIDRINSIFTTTESGYKIAAFVNNFIT